MRFRSFRSALQIALLLVPAVLGSATAVLAADAAFVGVLALAVKDDVADKLGISADKRAELLALIDQRESAALELALQAKDLPEAEQAEKLAPFRAESEALGLRLLAETQRQQLRALRFERSGLTALAEPDVAAQLKLTAEQKQQISTLLKSRQAALAKASASDRAAVQVDFDRQLSAVLDAAQQARWTALAAGTPGEIAATASPGVASTSNPSTVSTAPAATAAAPATGVVADPAAPRPVPVSEVAGPAATAAPATAAAPTTPAASVANAPMTPSAASPSTVVKPSEEPSVGSSTAATPSPTAATTPAAVTTPATGAVPETMPPIAGTVPATSPATSATPATPATGTANQTAEKPAGAEARPSRGSSSEAITMRPATRPAGPPGSERLRFSFRFKPWKEVLDWFAQQADLSLVMESPPPGTFNYQDSKTYTPAEAIDLLNSILLTKGYTLIRRERMLMLVNLQDGIPANLVPYVPLEDLDSKGQFELITVVFRLSKLTPEEAEGEVRKLIGPQGSVVVLSKSGQIVVTETAGRLRTIRSVLKSVEEPDAALGDKLHTFTLQHATTQDALSVIRQLLNIPPDRTVSSDGSLRIAVDPSGKLLVSGKPEAVRRVEEVIKVVDVPNAASDALAGAPQLEVYSVAGADPASVLAVLTTLMTGVPDLRLTTDPRTGNIVALARPAQHATIKATIEQMQRDARHVEVIRLRSVDPQLAVLSINKLFGGEGDGAAANAPKIEADTTHRQLLVRGSEAQIAQIRALLEKMGETQTAADVAADSSKPSIRMIPLTGRAGRSALSQLEQIWPTVHRNKIRVVTPSAMMPTLQAGEDDDESTEKPAAPTGEATKRTLPNVDPELLRRLLPNVAPPDAGNESIHERGRPAPADTPAPRAVPVKPTDDSTRRPSRTPVRFAAQTVEEGAEATADKKPEETTATGPSEKSAADETAAKSATTAGSPIVVSVGPGGIMITSEDTKALDDFEQMLRSLGASSAAGGREFTVFYLKYAKAAVVSELLTQIFGGSSGSSSSGGGGSGSLMGDIAGAAFGDMGGGLMGSLLGMGGGGGDEGATVTLGGGTVAIVPDSRLNALIVQANPADLDTLEQLLKVLDQRSGPEEVLVSARPQLIRVVNTNAESMAAVVRQVYADRIVSGAGAQGQARQPSPQEFLQALRGGGGRGGRRGGRGGGGGGQGGNAAEQDTQKITVGVDARTNSLIVSAPDALFNEVKALVEQLDQVTAESTQTMQVVKLKRTNPVAVQQTLKAIVGDAVQTTTLPNQQGTGQGMQQPGGMMSQMRRMQGGYPGGGQSGQGSFRGIESFGGGTSGQPSGSRGYGGGYGGGGRSRGNR